MATRARRHCPFNCRVSFGFDVAATTLHVVALDAIEASMAREVRHASTPYSETVTGPHFAEVL